jgi:RNA 2',3'-cyclic 3'-phosphodiesterase
MRTFIAVPLSLECKFLLSQTQEHLRTFDADVRWVSIDSIHLTLKFLGEVDPALLPELAARLRAASAGMRRFQVSVSGLGGFPDLRSPRVLWCGVGGDLERLGELQHNVEDACGPLGFPPEGREFRPHLTLGRVQGKRNLQPLLDYIRIAVQPESTFAATGYSIYKSDLRPRGAVYNVLETITFEV